MKITKNPVTIAQARKALERAKARGRVDEIRRASGQLAGARSHERAEVRRAVNRTVQAVAAQAAAIAAQPAGLTPAQRGAQTRKLRRLEREALQARVRAERELPQPPAADPRPALLVDAWRRLQPGKDAFGGAYSIVDPCRAAADDRVYWYGVTVSVDAELAIQYRWTGRATSLFDSRGDLVALKESYGEGAGADPGEEVPDECTGWVAISDTGLENARNGLPFSIVVAVVRK